MNKAGKHIQSGASIGVINAKSASYGGGLPAATSSNNNSNGKNNINNSNATTATPPATHKNVFNSIMSFLPDNRPITSLQIVEDFEKCPKNFIPINKTYDQDSDADLWRENNILFGKQTSRYLCLSKTEGLPEYVVETLRVIADKAQPPKEFSLLSRTADTEQKAWRKRQIAYKLSKRGSVTQAVTDIILCSKLKAAPEGFTLAGDINGVLVCYKTGAIPVRLPPPVPALKSPLNGDAKVNNSDIEGALNCLNLKSNVSSVNGNNSVNVNRISGQPLPALPAEDHDYEEISASYQLTSPIRPAPPRPASTVSAGKTSSAFYPNNTNTLGTLGAYSEVDGVPFTINPTLKQINQDVVTTTLPEISARLKDLTYDFQLERQILCTMKSTTSKNPFFQ